MSDSANSQQTQQTTIPVVAEAVVVEKRDVDTTTLQVKTTVREHIEHIDEPLFQEVTEVVRMPVNTFAHEVTGIRQEGDTTIIPIFEERAMVVKRLYLKEEIHLVKRKIETRLVEDVHLKVTDAHVQRISQSGSTDSVNSVNDAAFATGESGKADAKPMERPT